MSVWCTLGSIAVRRTLRRMPVCRGIRMTLCAAYARLLPGMGGLVVSPCRTVVTRRRLSGWLIGDLGSFTRIAAATLACGGVAIVVAGALGSCQRRTSTTEQVLRRNRDDLLENPMPCPSTPLVRGHQIDLDLDRIAGCVFSRQADRRQAAQPARRYRLVHYHRASLGHQAASWRVHPSLTDSGVCCDCRP